MNIGNTGAYVPFVGTSERIGPIGEPGQKGDKVRHEKKKNHYLGR